jgi:ketosteroid isomerase-like protein
MDDIVAKGYERWDANDLDGFLELFTHDAVFVEPGSTRVSGDRDETARRGVLENGFERCCLIFDNFARIDGTETK